MDTLNIAAAVFTDLDQSEAIELITAGEWTPIEIWSYGTDGFELKYRSKEKGWWSALHAVNLDQDETLEIVAGNWGINSQYQASPDLPIQLHFNDFDQNGTIDPILSYNLENKSYPLIARDDLIAQLPLLKKHFTSYEDYALVDTDQLLTLLPGSSKSKEVDELQSGIFDLQENKLVMTSLPLEAQVAPIFDVVSLDIDNDGDTDLVCGGNSSYNRVSIGEVDGNHGLVLINNGGFQFQSMSPSTSSLQLRGDLRSLTRITTSRGSYLVAGMNNGPIQSYFLAN